MDLGRCTAGQREIIETLDRPIMVAAGAGSGKTFTLTQRIVSAVLSWDEQGAGSIDRVLAITFTKKAAAELRSRIKRLLDSEGLKRQALQMDDAWVSTIHGMASRILREHALELGIDPAFEVISESLADELRAEAVERVVRDVEELDDPLVTELLATMPLLQQGAMGQSVVGLALRVLARAEAMPAGLGGVKTCEPVATPGDLMRAMADLGAEFKGCAASWKKPGKREQEYLDELDTALERVEAWFASAGSCGFLDGDFDEGKFFEAFFAFPPTSQKFHEKKEDAGFFADYRFEYARLAREATASCAARRVKALLAVTEMIARRFSELKGPTRMDNADLLRCCARALEEHPDIARSYREQFDLIMVDEFQDTDKLQVSIIERIAKPGFGNVCTVGDAQQSIYRFRGADVNVFLEYRDALRSVSPDARFVNLPDNFRSHADVLAVVDRIFGSDEVFGDQFLHLEPKAPLNAVSDEIFDVVPRVQVDLVHYTASNSKVAGVTKDEAIAVCAQHIAAYFGELRDRGAQASGMAVLLGTMSHADAYAQALREVGLESVIDGGSVFTQTEEARLVGDLLKVAVDEADEAALFSVLTSRLFCIGDDVLLALTRSLDPRWSKRRLWRGFFDDEIAGEGLDEGDLMALDHARACLRAFVRDCRAGSASRALRSLLVASGVLDRLGGQGAAGLAFAGNLEKAARILVDLEAEAWGPASLSHAYEEHMRTAKEAPGKLRTSSTEHVRIMTVHASKGLEFDYVAIADLGKGAAASEGVVAENIGDATFVAGSVRPDGAPGKQESKLRAFTFDDETPLTWEETSTPGDLFASLTARCADEALSESRRLLYVALTRAVKSVMLCYVTRSKPADQYVSDGIYRDVYRALGWEVESGTSVSMCEYGGSGPAKVALTCLQAEESERAGETTEEPESSGSATADQRGNESFSIAVRRDAELPYLVQGIPQRVRDDVRSYTSLSHSTSGAQEAPPEVRSAWAQRVVDEEAAAEDRTVREVGEDATALGTLFHTLAQRAIEGAVLTGARELVRPDEGFVAACAARDGLSDSQRVRLLAALDRWFSSSVARKLCAYGTLAAEVPFMVEIAPTEPGGRSFYLEGEIDGLADDGCGNALFIDYKTGGRADETDAELAYKHLLQAQCYAYALFRAGYSTVSARFVRVEQDAADTPGEPQVIAYDFDESDVGELERVVRSRFEASVI